MTFPVFLINLEGSDVRLSKATAQLIAAGLPFERVPAFDGRRIEPEDYPGCDVARARSFMGRPLRGGEIGCYMSHLDAARRFVASAAPFALVLEDDFRFVDGGPEVIARVFRWADQRPVDWDVINLGNNRHKIYSTLQNFTVAGQKFALTKAHYFPMTTSAIVWSRSGAQAFIDGHRRIFAPVDNYLRHWQVRADRGLSVWPAPVSTIDSESQIDTPQSKRSGAGRSALYGLMKQRRQLIEKSYAIAHKIRFQAGL